MPTFQGQVSEEELLQLDRVHQDRSPCRPRPTGARRRTSAAGAKQRPNEPGATDAAPRRGAAGSNYLNADYGVQVVAADDGPQADRAPVPGLHHAHLLRRRGLRGRASAWSCSRRRATSCRRTPTTSSSRMHGIVMVFFFLIPSIPAVLGNFLLPMMIGARDLAFPRLNLLSWYIFMVGAASHALRDGQRRRRHRLDVLHALQHGVLEHDGRRRRASASSSPASRRS